MKRLLLFCLLTALMFFSPAPKVQAADAFSIYLLNLADLKSDFPDPVDTYEDVDPITNIKPRFSGSGPIIRHSTLMSSYNGGAIPQADGQALIDKINSTNGMILTYPPHSFVDFLLSDGRFYLDSGEFDEYGVWHEQTVSVFPYDYDKTKRPHYKRFFLCLKGGFKYIRPFSLPPNAKSCDHNRSLCSYGPCQREEREDGDENGNGIPNEVIVPENHPPHAPFNMYYKLGTIIESNYLNTATRVKENESGIEFTMNFKDRTPPIILGCIDGNFPEIGTFTPATTGDWYKVEGLKIEDNSTKKIGTALAIGKIDSSPAMTWQSEEDWIFEAPRIIDSGEETDYIILPNSCHGVMRYSVFAWDENGLVNPGEPQIASNSPEVCYGLRNPPYGSEDLLRDPVDAKPWPSSLTIDFPSSNSIDYIKSRLTPGDRRGEGLVHIRDNDLPNILIRIESAKDRSRIFFPPVIAPGDLTIIPSTEYKKALGMPDANAADYQDFLGPLPAIPYTTDLLQDLTKPLYFRIFEVAHPALMTTGDHGLLQKFKDPLEHEFIRKHFRLEDYNESDTLASTGLPDPNPDNFGKRCGIGESITAILDLPGHAMIQEDVEYMIDVWADDNVKWATIDSGGAVLENIVPIPTGIVAGSMIVDIPNQYPPARHEVIFNPNEAVNGKLKVVFREPTPPVGAPDEAALISNRFPSIEVRVTDYAGLQRKIKLYLRVSNENPDIRVIDRKHEKKN